MTENTLLRTIQHIRLAGEHPLLQYDILDAEMLYSVLQVDRYVFNPWNLAKLLKSLGMRRIGLHSVDGWRVHLWTCLPGYPPILDIVRDRLRTKATHLHTELLVEAGVPIIPPPPDTLLTPMERDVLSLRLQRHPARRIAAMLGTHPYAVYAASQQVRIRLRVASLANLDELREKAIAAGALMDDPAFT